MKPPDPIKVLFASGIFLAVLYFTSAVFPAVLLSLAVFLILHNLLKLGGLFLFTLIIYPLVGVYLAAIIGYASFIMVFHKLDEGRYAFILALFFLVLCPVLLVTDWNDIAEIAAVLAYIFLIWGQFRKS